MGAATASLIPASPSIADPAPAAEELLRAQWDFSAGTGEDLSGNGHDATVGSGATFMDSGVSFDGTAEGVLTIPYSNLYQPEVIGKGGHWRLELTGVVPARITGDHQAIISARANTQGWIVYLDPSGEIEFWMRQVSGDDYWAQLASGVIAEAGRSYDISAEWDGETFSVSVTGASVGGGSMAIGDRYQPMAVTQPVRLGAGGEFGDAFFYAGSISSASIRAVIGEPDVAHPDVSFFGSWDEAAGAWAVAPRLDYAAAETLADVESAAKAEDYGTASTALHEHFRDRADTEPPSASYSGPFIPDMISLFLDNIWTLGSGEIFQDVVALGPEEETVSADVSEALVRAFESGASHASFFLMARRKSPTTFSVRSRTAAGSAPVLEMTQEDGSTLHLEPAADTYIMAGENASTNFGNEPEILVRDDGAGPFSETTTKAYVTFDTRGLAGRPSSASLMLTGSHDASGDHEIVVFQTLESFDEDMRTWDNTVQNTYSWHGDPGGFDWLTPPGADVEYGYQIARFNLVSPLIDHYLETGDEDIAAGLLDIISDFITDGDSYPTPYGAGSLPRSLDTAARIDNWLYALEHLRGSEVMTAEDLTAMIRTLDKSGQFLSKAYTGTPNWLTSQMSSLTSLGLYFPEFIDGAAWLEQSRDFLSDQLSSTLYPDGGFVESSSSYAYGTASTFVGLHVRFREAGYELDGLEELHGLVSFLADQNYPNGFNPAYGDSDIRDRSGSLEYWADFLDDPTITYRATGGTRGEAPGHTSVSYPDTRVVVLRSDWAADANYLRINADIGNHSHPDDLAISVFAGGRELIPETGTFTYSNDPRSEWLRRQTEAQSTVEVDGSAQSLHADGEVASFFASDHFDLTQLWTDANHGVRHTRTVVFLRPGAWLVGDLLVPDDQDEHTYRQNWHFLPDATPEIDLETAAAVTNHDSGSNVWVVPADAEVSAHLRDGYYSSAFYSVQDSTYLSYERGATGPIGFDTLLVPVTDPSVPQPRLHSIEVDAGSGVATAGELTLPTVSATYCLIHDVGSLAGPVRFGEHRTDAMFAYVEREKQRQRWMLHRGTELGSNHDLISSPGEIHDLVVDLDPAAGTVAIVGSDLVADVDPASAIGLRAPWAKGVTLNGESVRFEKHGPLIYAAAAGR